MHGNHAWGPKRALTQRVRWGERRHHTFRSCPWAKKSPLPISGVVWSLRPYCRRDGKLFGKKFAKPPKLWAYLHQISKNHTTMQSDHLQLITATVLSIGGLILLFCGIFIDPQGQIHETLLVAFGETATFAGALFGIDYVYKKRP